MSEKPTSNLPSIAPPIVTADRLARAHTAEAVGTLVQVMRNGAAKDSDRIKAAEVLLERGHGKAVQPIVKSNNGSAAARLAAMTTEAILDKLAERGVLPNATTKPKLPVIDAEVVEVRAFPLEPANDETPWE